VSACRNFEVSGPGSRGGSGGRGLDECVGHDLCSGESAGEKIRWKNLIVGKPSNPCMHEETDVS